MSVEDQGIPLCVDCDGTLIHTDLLYESLFLLLKHSLLQAFLFPFWLIFFGKAEAKLRIARRVSIDASLLPYSTEVVQYILTARQQGRKTVLVTASVQSYAESIAMHLGLFDDIFATNEADRINISGEDKANTLVAAFGRGGFEYIGNSRDDLPVWKAAGAVSTANAAKRVIAQAKAIRDIEVQLGRAAPTLVSSVRAMRLHQWLKNVLIFVPLITAHRITEAVTTQNAILAFIAFGFCASSVYILNDLLDIEADRKHSRKKNRPFAAGQLSIPVGLALMTLLLAMTVALLTLLPVLFSVVLAVYYATTLLYSFRLKRQVIVDVMMLSGLYTIRILAGTAATGIEPSFWLLAFSIFIFLSLAFVKRYIEMIDIAKKDMKTSSGRGYSVSDLVVLLALGAASGYSATLVFALYINSPEVTKLYPHPQFLWLVMPTMVYWISRVWLKAHRGEIHDDPVVFAAKDWQSFMVAALIGLVGLAASYRN